jgi:hypothetical protein
MPAWKEARRIGRAILSEKARPSGADPDGHKLEDQPVRCFFCGEKRVSRLVVTRLQGWGPAYRCKNAAECERRQAED